MPRRMLSGWRLVDCFRLCVRRLYRAPTNMCQLEDRLHAGVDCTAMKRSSCPALAGGGYVGCHLLTLIGSRSMHVREDGADLGSSCSLILDPICCALAAHVACEVRSRKNSSRVARCAILTNQAADLRNTS